MNSIPLMITRMEFAELGSLSMSADRQTDGRTHLLYRQESYWLSRRWRTGCCFPAELPSPGIAVQIPWMDDYRSISVLSWERLHRLQTTTSHRKVVIGGFSGDLCMVGAHRETSPRSIRYQSEIFPSLVKAGLVLLYDPRRPEEKSCHFQLWQM